MRLECGRPQEQVFVTGYDDATSQSITRAVIGFGSDCLLTQGALGRVAGMIFGGAGAADLAI